MIFTGVTGDGGVYDTEQAPPESVHWDAEKPAGEKPPGPEPTQETTPVAAGAETLESCTPAVQVVAEPMTMVEG
jgi:hypothetical protein